LHIPHFPSSADTSHSKNKIAKDPNNNTWSRDTDRFGHKILTAQGWTPGSSLGAKDAPHARHFTAASTSHIKVAIKADNLGLGANGKLERAETFGLNMFEGLLGRLNGKSEVELKKEETSVRDKRLRFYQGQRWGLVTFVRGGYLVGDSIQKRLGVPAEPSTAPSTTTSSSVEEDAIESSKDVATSRKSKKRKRALEEPSERQVDVVTEKREKNAKKSKKARREEEEQRADPAPLNEEVQPVAQHVADKQKRGSKREKWSEEVETLRGTSQERQVSDDAERRAEKNRRKAENRARKEAKALKRQEKAAASAASTATSTVASEREDGDGDDKAQPASSKTSSDPGLPKATQFTVGRHAVRQRYIRQKRMALSDPQALKEVCISIQSTVSNISRSLTRVSRSS
jgi:Pin2-interacting protein X1